MLERLGGQAGQCPGSRPPWRAGGGWEAGPSLSLPPPPSGLPAAQAAFRASRGAVGRACWATPGRKEAKRLGGGAQRNRVPADRRAACPGRCGRVRERGSVTHLGPPGTPGRWGVCGFPGAVHIPSGFQASGELLYLQFQSPWWPCPETLIPSRGRWREALPKRDGQTGSASCLRVTGGKRGAVSSPLGWGEEAFGSLEAEVG